jgi:hypothetical protein
VSPGYAARQRVENAENRHIPDTSRPANDTDAFLGLIAGHGAVRVSSGVAADSVGKRPEFTAKFGGSRAGNRRKEISSFGTAA